MLRIVSATMATEARPKNNPAAPAATMGRREARGLGRRWLLGGSLQLVTTGASLGGGTDSSTAGAGAGRTRRGGGNISGASSAAYDGDSILGSFGVGIARSVTLSLKLTGAGSLGGGGRLERATGMSLETGASPPRTTTA